MAGFALNVDVLWIYHPMRFNTTDRPGMQETKYEICCDLSDIEPLADECTKILVWHTQTKISGDNNGDQKACGILDFDKRDYSKNMTVTDYTCFKMTRQLFTNVALYKIRILRLFTIVIFIVLAVHFAFPFDYRTFKFVSTVNELPIIYAITATYYRLTQRADVTRLANTLRQVKSLYWIVVEDSDVINPNIYDILNSTGLLFTYIARKKVNTTKPYIRGSDQKNAALDWIMDNHNQNMQAVFYFVDDDNSYSLEIFEQLRYTKKLSMWPVGLSGGRIYETPNVFNGKVYNFSAWNANERKFAIDMAGFALNVDVLWIYHPMRFNTTDRPGMQETTFLEICCDLSDIEPLADNCTKILVWHTQTQKPEAKTGDQKLVV